MAKQSDTSRSLGYHWVHTVTIDRVGADESRPDSTEGGVLITVDGETQDGGSFTGTFGMNQETFRSIAQHIRANS